MPRTVRALSLIAFSAFSAACGGGSTEPPRAAAVAVTPNVSTAARVGESIQFTAVVQDGSGNAIPGSTLQWSSSASEVATVDANGLATAVGDGTASIRASSSGVTGSASFRVALVASVLEKAEGDLQVSAILVPTPVDPEVRLLDAGGSPIKGRRIDFAVVSGGGLVGPESILTGADGTASTRWTLGETAGTQTMQASVEGFSVEFTATGETGILAVRTLNLEDARATLPYSAQFEALGGEAPFIWTVASGSLPTGLTMNANGSISGSSSSVGSSSFTALVQDAGGGSATSNPLTLRVCKAPLALAVGQVYEAGPASSTVCATFLPSGSSGDRYRVGVVRGTYDPSLQPGSSSYTIPLTVSFTEKGVNANSSIITSDEAPAAYLSQRALPEWVIREAEIANATEGFHQQLYADAERLFKEIGSPLLSSPPRPNGAFLRQVADPLGRIVITPFNSDLDNTCVNPERATATLVAFNDHLAFYQDSAQAATLGDLVTGEVQQILDYFDDYGQPTILEYFGDVGDMNGDDRVVVVVSPSVQDNVAAFVWPGDFFTSGCPASNQMELIYFGRSLLDDFGANERYPSFPVMVHEMKHVSSLFRRFSNGAFHPTWVEEGGAEIAAEMSSRMAMAAVGDIPVGGLLKRTTFPPTGIASAARAGVLQRLIRMLFSYSGTVNSLTTNPNDNHSFYGTSWHFQRFLGDAYGNAANGADGALFRALNDGGANIGVRGFEDITGQSFGTLMKEYAAAMMLNGMGTPAPSRGFTTYEFTTATNILVTQPSGTYPWPATGSSPVGFQSRTYPGELAPAGLRFYDLESDGSGDGVEVRVTVGSGAAEVIIVRVN